MERIRAYAGRFYRDRRACPSVGEIARALGIAKTTAYRYLLEMNERRRLLQDGGAGSRNRAGTVCGHPSAKGRGGRSREK